jgi:hypothetical protein
MARPMKMEMEMEGEEPARKKPAKSSEESSEVFGSEAAYARFLPIATRLDADEIIPMRADASLAYHNVARGLSEVMEFEDHIKEHLPRVDLGELKSLPDLALGVVFASFKANSEGGESDTRALLVEAHALRRLLVVSAEAAGEAGFFSAKELAKVREGRGSSDMAGACVMLASLFTKHAEALAEKTAVTEEQVERAGEVGAELLRRFKPKGARRKGDAGTVSAAEERDRLWTLLSQRHERLWAVGAYVFGHAVDELVPGLLARAQPRAKSKRAEG